MYYKIFAFFALGFLHVLNAEFKFEEYEASSLEEYLSGISEEFSTIDKAEYEKSKKELDECLQNHDKPKTSTKVIWAKLLLKAKTLLTYPDKTADDSIKIALFALKATENINKAYDYSFLCEKASYLAFQQSKNNLEKAKALMLYLNQKKWRINAAVLDELNKLYPIEKLREQDPRFKDVLKFKYINKEVEETPEGAILRLNFSQPLKIDQPENYIEIFPKVDGFIQVNGSQISISGFQAGIEYTVKLRSGVTSALDEKTDQKKEIGFLVKDLNSRISFPGSTYVYPKQEKIRLPVRTINIDKAQATLYRIPDRGIINNLNYLMRRSYHLGNAEEIFSQTLDFDGKAKPNQTITKNIEATKIIPELKPGIYVLKVRQKGVLEYYNAQEADQWFIVTDIGLTAVHSDQTLLVHSRAFSSAKSLKDIQLELISADNDVLATATTDEDGFAEFPKELLNGKAGKKPVAIFAKNETLGFSFLCIAGAGFDFSDRGVKGRIIHDDYDAMVFCERGIYRPDEKVNVAVILRNGQGKEVPVTPITVIFKSPKGTEIKRETLKGNTLGTYSTEYRIPADCPIGMWSVEIFVDPTKPSVGSTNFRVDDFSPNKMEMTLSTSEAIAKLGSSHSCNLNAYYLYGASVKDRQTILEAKISPNDTPFEKWKDFHFGLDKESFVSQVLTGTSEIIQDGKAELKVDIPTDLSCSKALRIDFTARLTDTASSQQASTSAILLTQPYIVGLKEKTEHSSENIEVEVIAVDSSGKLVAADDLEYTFYQSEANYQWYKDHGSWSYQLVYNDKPLKKGGIVTKNDGATVLSFKGDLSASYAIEIKQKSGTTVAKYRIGSQYSNQKDRPDVLKIIPEMKATKHGENAILRVYSPFEGEAIIIAGLNNIQLKDSVHLKKGENVLKIPTHETWGSGAYVMVSLVRPLEKKIPGIHAKRAVGVQWIQIDPSENTLNVKLDLPEIVKPQTQLKVPVQVENLKNKDARLMLAIVDEGVMGLTNFKTPDPIEYFFGQRQLRLEMHDLYSHIIDPVDAELMDMRSGGDSLMLRRGAFVPRINDKVLSFFDGDIHLDSNGKAEIIMDIPVFSGKLRVYAVAIANGKTGSQSGNVIVKDDLIVDTNLPSFLTIGDETDLNVRLENTTEKKIDFQISINLEKAFKSTSRKQTVSLMPKEEKRISFLANAKQLGEGIVQIEAKGEGIDYKHSTSVEVRSDHQPALISQMHKIKPKTSIDLKLEDVLKGVHAFQAQADLFLTNQGPWNIGKIHKWLLNYPFGCNQQTISKGFAGVFGVKRSKDDALNSERIEYQRISYEAIELLNERQNSTGGWGIWQRDRDDLNITSYALEMLLYARNAGLNVPKILIKNAMDFAKRQINSIDWKIKQGREKADDIAWLVKICACEQEIDTATTRYCFDEYFKKCDTVVGKSIFISAVASIQDLARVEKGIKHIKTEIEKGVSFENAVMISAHLSQFGNIQCVSEVMKTLEEIIHKSINEDITRLNTQTLAMLLKANADSISAASKELKVNINKASFIEKHSLSYKLDPLQDITIENYGDDPLWLFVNAYGIGSEHVPQKESGIKVSRTFYKPDGSKVNPEKIILGERIIIVLEGHIDDTNHEGYWLISDWLPCGFTHSNTLSNYDWLKDLNDSAAVQKRHDRYIASWKQPTKEHGFKIAYEVIATHTGKFQQPGLYVENMLNPTQYAHYESVKLDIKTGE